MRVSLIRIAQPRDVSRLQGIEAAADAAFFELFQIEGWGDALEGDVRAHTPGFLLVAPDPDDLAIGFAHVLELEGEAHLEQLSVDPVHARAGIGRALVAAATREARSRGFTRMTLRTYADVPWNAPLYSTCGFVEAMPDTPALTRLFQVDTGLGLDRFGRRIQMIARLE